MKASTRQYAKRQVQWIKNKLLPAVRESDGEVTVVLLDATGEPIPSPRSPPLAYTSRADLSRWKEDVLEPAIELLNSELVLLHSSSARTSRPRVSQPSSTTSLYPTLRLSPARQQSSSLRQNPCRAFLPALRCRLTR